MGHRAITFLGILTFSLTGIPDGEAKKSKSVTKSSIEWMESYYENLGPWVVAKDLASKDPLEWMALDFDLLKTSEGESDFLTYKENYYSQLKYKNGRHERKFDYFEDFNGLFHPPITEILPEDYENILEGQTPVAQRDLDLTHGYFNPEFHLQADQISQTELTFGNELQLLPNQESYYQKLRMLQETKEEFWGIVMAYACEPTTIALVEEMGKLVSQGKKVRMIVEGFHMITLNSPCVKLMRQKGVEVLVMSDFLRAGSFTGVMHNKFWIRDGEEAIIGGQNMMDASNLSDGFNRYSRDTDVLVKGPAVTDLMNSYVRLWQDYGVNKGKKLSHMEHFDALINQKLLEERMNGLRGSEYYAEKLGNPETALKGVCRVAIQEEGAFQHPIGDLYKHYASAAKESIFGASVSFSYNQKSDKKRNDQLAHLLQAKSEQGVRVDLLSNGFDGGMGEATFFFEEFAHKLESKKLGFLAKIFGGIGKASQWLQDKTKRPDMREMRKNSRVHTWSYFQHIHSKHWLFDGIVSAVGSWNLDGHSSELNHEGTIICQDGKLNEQMQHQVLLDLANALPIVSSNGK